MVDHEVRKFCEFEIFNTISERQTALESHQLICVSQVLEDLRLQTVFHSEKTKISRCSSVNGGVTKRVRLKFTDT